MSAEIGTVNIHDELTSFTWAIDVNVLLSMKKVEESIWSPVFLTPWQHNTTNEWRLQLYPNGINRKCRGYISIYLRQVEEKLSSFMLRAVHFSILNDNNDEINGVDVEIFSVFNSNLWGIDKFMNKSLLTKEIVNVLSGGKLMIKCCIADVKTMAKLKGPSAPVVPNKPKPLPRSRSLNDFLEEISGSEVDAESLTDIKKSLEITDDFEQFLETGESDVTFIASDKTFHAHRVILSSRSSTFSEMFEKDKLQSKETSIVEAEDLTGDVLKEVLRFIYINETTYLNEKAHEILSPANRYSLHELKAMCEEAMISKLDVRNASEYLVLSFLHNAAKLRDRAMEFVVQNSKDIMSTPGFQEMAGSHANVIAAIFATLSVKGQSKS